LENVKQKQNRIHFFTKIITPVKNLNFLMIAPLIASSLYAQKKPNIVFILADDLGYGDVSCLNPQSKINTVNMDRLAGEGVIFTDAHSSSSVCTPSRYSILTGRYNWRSCLQSWTLLGFDPPLINHQTYTLPQMLRDNGYHTACIGKWHLGMNWADSSGKRIASAKDYQKIDYSKPIENGPVSLGFDYFYGISGSLDMPPYVYIENDKVTHLPTVKKKWGREGPGSVDFEAINVIPDITKKAETYIVAHAKQPFFLYFPLTSPHTPIVPGKEFIGKSGLNAYGDFVVETDWVVGRIMHVLDSLKISNNTLVIVTSDNGFARYVLPSYNVEKLGHYPSYHFRGYKSDDWEGGHHIPFIVRWPGKVKPGTSNNNLIGQLDFMATCAEIVGKRLSPEQGVDSYSFLPSFLDSKAKTTRPDLVHHSGHGFFAIRKGDWKLILCPGSGGWSKPTNNEATKEGLPAVQLYNMAKDVAEKNNVEKDYPEIVKKLTALLEKYVREGRSTPGSNQSNDVQIDIWKKGQYLNDLK